MKVAALSSFGKDSLFAIHKYGKVDAIIFTEINFPRPSPHILNYRIAEKAAEHMSVYLKKVKLRKGKEKEDLARALQNFDMVIAGNVFIEEHRKWLESVAKIAGIDYDEPLWGYDTEKLLFDIIKEGFEAIIVGVDTKKLDVSYLGKILNEEIAENILQRDVEPCGEFGEYHTMVINSPLYRRKIDICGGASFVQDGYGFFKARICEDT